MNLEKEIEDILLKFKIRVKECMGAKGNYDLIPNYEEFKEAILNLIQSRDKRLKKRLTEFIGKDIATPNSFLIYLSKIDKLFTED